jgi:hypothetical protein
MKIRALLIIAILCAASACPAFSFSWIINTGGLVIHIGNTESGSVFSPTANPPVITSQPVSISTPAGSNAVFVVSVSGPGPLYYRWEKNGKQLTNNSRVSGAHASILHLYNLKSSDSGAYRVVIGNAGGYATSRVANLSVY